MFITTLINFFQFSETSTFVAFSLEPTSFPTLFFHLISSCSPFRDSFTFDSDDTVDLFCDVLKIILFKVFLSFPVFL